MPASAQKMIPRERSSQLENYGPRTVLGGLILISAWEKRFYSSSLANTALYRRCVLHEQFFQSGILETNSFQHGVARGRPINLKNVSLAGDAGAIAAIRANIASQGRRRDCQHVNAPMIKNSGFTGSSGRRFWTLVPREIPVSQLTLRKGPDF